MRERTFQFSLYALQTPPQELVKHNSRSCRKEKALTKKDIQGQEGFKMSYNNGKLLQSVFEIWLQRKIYSELILD